MNAKPPDTRIFRMTKTEASMLAAYWPKRMEVLAALQKIEGDIGDMKEELAERLSVLAGFEIKHGQIVNMDWSKREATITLPLEDPPEKSKEPEGDGKPHLVNRLPAEGPPKEKTPTAPAPRDG